MSKPEQFADISSLLDAIGEHGLAQEARDIAAGRLSHPDVKPPYVDRGGYCDVCGGWHKGDCGDKYTL